MKLLTKAILKRFEKLGRQEERGYDAEIVVKFFDPCGSWTWYATEYDPTERIFFGYVDGHEGELGYFGLAELEGYRGRLGLGIERDRWFPDKKLSDVMKERV